MNPGNFSVSAIILAKNEKERIAACLSGVGFCDERIVIDNSSTDDTGVIARKMGATVIASDASDFAKLRNLGRESSGGDFLLYVDADETVTPPLQEEIRRIIRSFDPERDPHVYIVKRKNYYLGHRWPRVERLERFFWKPALLGWHGELHESPQFRGRTAILNHPLVHDTHRTVEEMVNKTNEWSTIEARLRYESGHPIVTPWRLFRVMGTGYVRSFIGERGISAGMAGLTESVYQAFSMFVTYAKLYETESGSVKQEYPL